MIRLEPFELDPASLGWSIAATWAMALAVLALLHGLLRRFFQPRKLQPGSWSTRVFGHELFFSALNVCVAGTAIGLLSSQFAGTGALTLAEGRATPWLIARDVGLYFFAFDLYFYATHRLMHTEWLYRFVHSVHHRSTSPNPLTAFSFHPLEAVLTGSFLPVFLVFVEVHPISLGIISVALGPVLSMLVHSGHEVFPAWWYRSPVTRWILTPMYHDQHHQLFRCNYGAFTTLWDRAFGTANPTFEYDYAQHKALLTGAGAHDVAQASCSRGYGAVSTTRSGG